MTRARAANRRVRLAVLLRAGLAVIILAACSVGDRRVSGARQPRSIYCQEHGGRVTIVEDADGSQRGVCVFPDGSRCDGWAYFRGECDPGQPREAPR